jgi:hypothetical protein
MYKFVGRSLLIATLLIVAGVSTLAQGSKTGSMSCRDNNWYNDRLVGNCEIREQTLAPSGGTIAIDGRQNGGVRLKVGTRGRCSCEHASKLARPPRMKRSR